METRRIDQPFGIRRILGAEEDGGCEDSLETLNHSPIVTIVRSKAEEIGHLKSSRKVNDANLLLHAKGGYPYRDQPVLAERQAEFGMSCEPEKELSVPSQMGQLTGLRAAERETAEDKRPRVESELLFAVVALLACEMDGFELPQPAFRHRVGGQAVPNCGRNGGGIVRSDSDRGTFHSEGEGRTFLAGSPKVMAVLATTSAEGLKPIPWSLPETSPAVFVNLVGPRV